MMHKGMIKHKGTKHKAHYSSEKIATINDTVMSEIYCTNIKRLESDASIDSW